MCKVIAKMKLVSLLILSVLALTEARISPAIAKALNPLSKDSIIKLQLKKNYAPIQNLTVGVQSACNWSPY